MSADLGDDDAGPEPLASGTLTVAVARDQVHYVLKQRDGMYARLNLDHLSGAADAWRTASGSPVEVFGARNDDGSIDVDVMQSPRGIVEAESALVTTGTRRVLALRVQFDGGPTLGTEQDVRNTLDATARHLSGSSFGQMQLEYDVTGPLNVRFGSCDDYDRWMNEARSAAQGSGFDLGRYQHFMIFGKIDCGYGGLGAQPGDVTWIAGHWPEVVVHELGHNFGLWHASSRTCRSGGATVTMSDDCSFDEYGDPFDPMGHGGNKEYNANYKVNLGWIPTSQVANASADQTYTLTPMTEGGGGVKLLRVPGPNGLLYDVEFRQPTATNQASADEASVNGVLIHAFFTQSQDSGRAQLLDMSPGGNFDDAPLGVGKSFSFFGTDTTIEVVSVSSAGAQVKVSGGRVQPPAEGQRVLAAHSNKCIGVTGARQDNGAEVIQWPCNGSSDQSWKFEDVGGGTFVLRDVNSGKCLDVSGVSLDNGAKIHQWDCHGGANQRWKYIDRGNGLFSLQSVNSGRCLDVSGGSTADGAQYIQWDCHDGANQQFRRE